MSTQPSTDTVPYLYRPLAYFGNDEKAMVLKCAGIATPESRVLVACKALSPDPDGVYLPGLYEAESYLGDRVTLHLFKGLLKDPTLPGA